MGEIVTEDDIPDMSRETWKLVSQIPVGSVSTYGSVAEALGDRKAARFVALALSTFVGAPAGRVVRSDGSCGGVTGAGMDVKEKLRQLSSEGVQISGNRVRDMEKRVFSEFKTSWPLKALRNHQLKMRERLEIPPTDIDLDRVAGVDVAYDGDRAWVGLAVFDARSGRLVESHCAGSKARFPYIPTYLAYRELPMVRLLAPMVTERTVLMYDGNGVLHPEGFGVASHAGVLFELPTIGVAKRRLCGTLGARAGGTTREVEVNGKVAGYAVSKDGGSPIFVSPGHGVGYAQSLSIVRSLLKHRVPEPIRSAHALANRARHSASDK
jgi:deoxyribonuclease V